MIESGTEFIEECQQDGLANTTIESHTTSLELFSEWQDQSGLNAETCNDEDLKEFIEWLKHNWNEEYNEIRNTVFWSLIRYYEYLMEEGQCRSNSAKDVDVAKSLITEEAWKFLNRVRTLKAETTVQNHEFGLILFTEWLDQQGYSSLQGLEPLDLEEYAIYLAGKNYTDSTILSRFSTVSTLYTFLHDKAKVLEENPATEVDLVEAGIIDTYDNPSQKSEELKEGIYYVQQEDKEKLLEHVPSPKLRNELLIELLWQTGLRRTEVVDIEISDIDRENGEIKVRGKNDKNRTIFYQPSLEEKLNIWLDGGLRQSSMYAEESPYLFLTSQSGQLHPQHVNRVVLQAAKDAGIQEVLYEDGNGNPRYKITPHAIRHGFAVQSLKNGLDIKKLGDLMGHESLDTTKEYLKFTKEEERNDYRKYGPGGTEQE